MQYSGGCHCGSIVLAFETNIPPAEMTVRACQCTFCRKHNTRAVADPSGKVTISIRDPANINHYTFGLATAEYLVCRNCGVYVAAVTRNAPLRALVIVNCLDAHKTFSAPTVATNYDNETAQARTQRRATTWTPAKLN